jgi:hypothetical protein
MLKKEKFDAGIKNNTGQQVGAIVVDDCKRPKILISYELNSKSS